METFIRKGAIFLFILASCCASHTVRVDNQRTVKKEQKEDPRKEVFQSLLKSAQRWMTVRELTGWNDHPMITKAMKLCGLDGDKGYAWCAAAQTEIHEFAGLTAPHSARVVDWFKYNVVWEKRFGEMPPFDKRGMVGGIYFRRLGRLAHIVLIVGEDNNNFYTLEGNTSSAGAIEWDENTSLEAVKYSDIEREGDGFYAKIRSKDEFSALADYCLLGQKFVDEYDSYLKSKL